MEDPARGMEQLRDSGVILTADTENKSGRSWSWRGAASSNGFVGRA